MSQPHTDPVIRSDPLEAAAGIGSSGDSDTVIFDPIEASSSALRSGNAIFQFMKAAALWLARGFIAPCEVFFRGKIGERYFNGSVCLACALSLWAGVLSGYFSREAAATLFGVFSLAAGVHSVVCFIRDRKGKYWHSYSEGMSWLRLPSVDRFLARWFFTFDFSKVILEPLILIGGSRVVQLNWGSTQRIVRTFTGRQYLESNSVANYMLAAGIVLFAYQIYCWGVRRHRLLDALDHSVINEIKAHVPEVSSGVAVQTHRGVSFVPRTAAQAWRS